MRKSKFTDSQIMDAVKRVEAGFGVPDICREMGISTATFYKWRAKYGGIDLLPISRTKVLEQSPLISENSGYETIQIYR
jgi:putative transposase